MPFFIKADLDPTPIVAVLMIMLMHPYKIQFTQKLKSPKTISTPYADWALVNSKRIQILAKKAMFHHKAHFLFNGLVNMQNFQN